MTITPRQPNLTELKIVHENIYDLLQYNICKNNIIDLQIKRTFKDCAASRQLLFNYRNQLNFWFHLLPSCLKHKDFGVIVDLPQYNFGSITDTKNHLAKWELEAILKEDLRNN